MLTATTCDGVTTLTRPGPLDLPAARALGAALAAVTPHAEVVVLRGGWDGTPDPGHLATPVDRDVFAREVHAVLLKLAALPCPTVALIEGRCLGLGVDLAATCDWRLAVTGPDAWLDGGLGLSVTSHCHPPGLRTAREACRGGFADDAFTQRRAAVELALHTDLVQRRPRKRARLAPAAALADRRRAFLDADLPPVEVPGDGFRGWREVAVVAGDEACLAAAVEVCLRGGTAVALAAGDTELSRHRAAAATLFAEAERRGRVTPLEREQASARLTHTPDGAALSHVRRVLTARPAALRFLPLSPWAEVIEIGVPPAPAAMKLARAS
jgi:enoyl-CoA hydratase/carnithine racemase